MSAPKRLQSGDALKAWEEANAGTADFRAAFLAGWAKAEEAANCWGLSRALSDALEANGFAVSGDGSPVPDWVKAARKAIERHITP